VGASPARLSFTSNVLHAVADADFVQESSPERPDFKIQLFKEMDAAAKKDTILASSSSGLTMSMIQSQCARPDRCVIAHPCNPPHLIPLVEVVGGTQTSKQTIQRTVAFFREIGKRPITLKREVQGHVANRLRAALQRELISLLSAGVVDLADADIAVSWGPGLRWGVMGPNMLLHLAGGAGGIAHALDHVAGPMEMLWKDLGTQTELAEDTRALMLKGISAASGGKTTDELAYQRDHVLVRLILARRSFESQET
jgi:3-hydroxyacyl-CoA dehydrogenase